MVQADLVPKKGGCPSLLSEPEVSEPDMESKPVEAAVLRKRGRPPLLPKAAVPGPGSETIRVDVGKNPISGTKKGESKSTSEEKKKEEAKVEKMVNKSTQTTMERTKIGKLFLKPKFLLSIL